MAALIGVALIILVNSFLGNVPRTDSQAVLEHINERPWFVMRLAGVVAMLAWVAAFSAIGGMLRNPLSGAIARMAQPTLIVAVAVFAIDYAHDGFSIGVLAQRWASGEVGTGDALAATEVLELLIGATSMLAQTLVGLGLLAYAVAMLVSREYSRVLCWLGIVGSAGWFLGGAALVARVPGIVFEVVLPFAGLASVWVTGIGITLLRRAAQPRTASSQAGRERSPGR